MRGICASPAGERAIPSGVLRLLPTFFLAIAWLARPASAASVSDTPVRELAGHTDAVHGVAFAPDGTWLVSASFDRTLRIWDVATGVTRRVIQAHEGPVYAVAVSRDGKHIASAGSDRVIKIWDPASGEQVGQLEGHAGIIRALSFLPDGTLASAAITEGSIRFWDVAAEKERWRINASPCVHAFALDAAGKRLAYEDCGETFHLWDLTARKEIGRFVDEAGNEHFIGGIALSPDGKTLYAHGLHGVRAFDADKHARLPDPNTNSVTRGPYTISPDGTMLAWGRLIIDPATKQAVIGLNGVGTDTLLCHAFSPDGRWLAAGSGGDQTDRGWQPTRKAVVQLYALPPHKAPGGAVAATGQPDGVLSWDTLPAAVRDRTGKQSPLASRGWRAFTTLMGPGWRACTNATAAQPKPPKPRDLIVNGGAVLLHREPGVFDEVATDRNAGYCDPAWDGARFWVTSLKGGILVIDPEGHVTATVGVADGLPAESMWSVLVHPLGDNRVLVTASADPKTMGGGWCCVIEPNPSGPGNGRPYAVRMLFRNRDLPDRWGDKFGNTGVPPDGNTYVPVALVERPADGKQPREVWIFCQQTARSDQPIIRVNVDDLSYRTFNLIPLADEGMRQRPTTRPAVAAMRFPPVWAGPKQLIAFNNESYVALDVGDKPFLDFGDRRLVYDARPGLPVAPVLDGDTWYLPGRQWHAIDLKTARTRRLGPGPRADGEPLTDELFYFRSALCGLAAVNPETSTFYRFSADPTHALATRGSRDVPKVAPATAPIPAPGRVDAGLIDFGGAGTVTFRQGAGALTFRDGRVITRPDWDSGPSHAVATAAAESRHGLSAAEVALVRERLFAWPSERARIGMSDEQFAAFRQATNLNTFPGDLPIRGFGGRPFPDEQRRKWESMYAAYAGAADDAQRAAAAEPLCAEASKLGERWVEQADAFVGAFKAQLTDRQWALLRYDIQD